MLRRFACASGGAQKPHVDPRRVREVRKQAAASRELDASLLKPLGQPIYGGAHRSIRRHQWMAVDDEDPKFAQRFVPCQRQQQPVANALAHLIGAGNGIERRSEVGGGSGHRTDHRKVARKWQWLARRLVVTAKWHQTETRLVRVNAAEMGRHAQGPTDVRSERQRPKAGGKSRRRSAGRTSGRTAYIPRIVGRSVDVVVALKIAEA